MPDQTEPRLTGHGRHPTTGELLHFTVEGCGERVVVAKTAAGKWKAGEWKTMEEIAAEHAAQPAQQAEKRITSVVPALLAILDDLNSTEDEKARAAVTIVEAIAPDIMEATVQKLEHRASWRSAILMAIENAKVEPPDIDDKAYWRHELKAFDEFMGGLRRPSAPPAESIDPNHPALVDATPRVVELPHGWLERQVKEAAPPAEPLPGRELPDAEGHWTREPSGETKGWSVVIRGATSFDTATGNTKSTRLIYSGWLGKTAAYGCVADLPRGHWHAASAAAIPSDTAACIAHIEANLETQAKWTRQDYADFYSRDIARLLPLAKAYVASEGAEATGRRRAFYAMGGLVQAGRDEITAQAARIAELEAILPSTFYADRPFAERLCFMVDQWRRLHEVTQSLESRLAKLEGERILLARTYDPNCDEYVHTDELAKMTAARQVIERVQELANAQGRDPEGCLFTVLEEAIAAESRLASYEQRQRELTSLLEDFRDLGKQLVKHLSPPPHGDCTGMGDKDKRLEWLSDLRPMRLALTTLVASADELDASLKQEPVK